MAITLRAVEMVMFGACVMSKKRFFGLADKMMVEAASMALHNDQTMTCPLHILVALLSGNNIHRHMTSGDGYSRNASRY